MRFLAIWGGNLSFWGTKKGLSDTSTSPMDRACRVLSGAIILRSGASHLTNWWVEYWVLGVFGAVIWAFRAQGRIDLKHQSLQSIDRARRALSGAIIVRLGVSRLTNRHRKYSNRTLGYLTC